jgi:hypothetical protein
MVLGSVLEEQILSTRDNLNSEAESSFDYGFDWELGCSADADDASLAGERDIQNSTLGVNARGRVIGKASASNSMVKPGGSKDSSEDTDVMLLFSKKNLMLA